MSPMQTVACRLPGRVVQRLDQVVTELAARFPSRQWTRSDALRLLVDQVDVADVLRPGIGPGAGAHREGR